MRIVVEVADVPRNGVVRTRTRSGIHLTVDPRATLDLLAAAIAAIPAEVRTDARQALVSAGVLPGRYWALEVGAQS